MPMPTSYIFNNLCKFDVEIQSIDMPVGSKSKSLICLSFSQFLFPDTAAGISQGKHRDRESARERCDGQSE